MATHSFGYTAMGHKMHGTAHKVYRIVDFILIVSFSDEGKKNEFKTNKENATAILMNSSTGQSAGLC